MRATGYGDNTEQKEVSVAVIRAAAIRKFQRETANMIGIELPIASDDNDEPPKH